MTLEGIVAQVVPQKERDVLARLILREGSMVGVYVYGGMGGGKNAKPRIIEPGAMLRIETRAPRAGMNSELLTGSETTLLWRPVHMRHHAEAFALTCLLLEMALKTCVPYHPDSPEGDQEHVGLFNVLSNGLFHLDQAVGMNDFRWRGHLMLFMAKYLLQLGILPDESSCVFCGSDLNQVKSSSLVVEQGGFACSTCAHGEGGDVRGMVALAVRTRYPEWPEFPDTPAQACIQLMQFWGYHLHVKLPELGAYRLLFQGN